MRNELIAAAGGALLLPAAAVAAAVVATFGGGGSETLGGACLAPRPEMSLENPTPKTTPAAELTTVRRFASAFIDWS